MAIEIQSLGIKEGDPLHYAQSSFPDCFFMSCRSSLIDSVLLNLANWLKRFSPLVGVDFDREVRNQIFDGTLFDGLIIDCQGTERVHGGLVNLLKKVQASLDSWGFSNRVAIASTIGAAWGAARFSNCRLIYIDEGKLDVIESFPLKALRLHSADYLMLKELGFESVGEILKLSYNQLNRRFSLGVVRRIKELKGETIEQVDWLREEVSFEHTYEINSEYELSDRKQLSRICLDLFLAGQKKLSDNSQKANRFIWIFYFRKSCVGLKKQVKEHAAINLEESVRLGIKKKISQRLQNLIGSLVDSFDRSNQLIKIKLIPKDYQFYISEQESFSRTLESRDDLRELLNNFYNEIGSERISIMKVNESFIPERSIKISSTLSDSTSLKPLSHTSGYPSYIFDLPISVEVKLDQEIPTSFKYSNCYSTILAYQGPTRIRGVWWQQNSFDFRDYYKIKDDLGRCFWLFRQDNQNWFLQGIWV